MHRVTWTGTEPSVALKSRSEQRLSVAASGALHPDEKGCFD